MKAFPELTAALGTIIERIENSLAAGGYAGEPIQALLAGGMAINYYCGTRTTRDIDVRFSKPVLLPGDLTVAYQKEDGTEGWIYFDRQNNTSFAFLHEGFARDSIPHETLNGPRGDGRASLIELRVLSPVDLAVSKLARYSENDKGDIYALALEGLITVAALRERAEEALVNYIGDKNPLRSTIHLVCKAIEPCMPINKPVVVTLRGLPNKT